ncbi:SAM hydrolase/SAM-dependent halogenase family protein [Aquifex aeolicus]|uniref:Uncharacterized protein n=1 Tax=Aquifex aeolicus (strain VF5) TaxID=224324 RepID=O67940_AQUAE|nr:S-adenosyl-l-methionine hydroxide adenosyltransferase family protein [Aquifex aeolicus]AAC07908.1 hypothetical protein aq_2196 [Aquifex aeolicus VF5]
MAIVLLTDFGTKDGFVGAVKGVILSINPSVQIVDLSHEVDSFNVLEGALLLKAHYSYFPEKSVFVGVVDPGVGSERKGIIVKTEKYFFVGPDNGLFDLVIKEAKDFEVYEIKNEKFTLPKKNNTFHGRDVFAPVAAYLSKGVKPEEIGPRIEYREKLKFPEPKREKDFIEGEIIYFDKFGNAITNVPCGKYAYAEFREDKLKVVPYFLAGERGKLNATCGSFGFMEIFVPVDNAREKFNLKEGEKIKFFII